MSDQRERNEWEWEQRQGEQRECDEYDQWECEQGEEFD